MLMMAVSLPGGKPSGMVWTRPSTPRSHSESKYGFWQTSSGVLPPSSSRGSSAMPSPIISIYFMWFPPYVFSEDRNRPALQTL